MKFEIHHHHHLHLSGELAQEFARLAEWLNRIEEKLNIMSKKEDQDAEELKATLANIESEQAASRVRSDKTIALLEDHIKQLEEENANNTEVDLSGAIATAKAILAHEQAEFAPAGGIDHAPPVGETPATAPIDGADDAAEAAG